MNSRNATGLFIALAAVAAPMTATAQSRSILQLLPTEGRQLRLGEPAQGALSASDVLSTNDAFLEAWALEGQAGQSVTIDVMSEDFDARVYVIGPGMVETETDDDSGGGCDARLTLTMLESGTYTVVASSNSRNTGTYQIRATEEPESIATYGCGQPNPAVFANLPTDNRRLRRGQVAQGTLTGAETRVEDRRPAQAWAFEARAGQTLRVSLDANYDTYLYVSGPGLGEVLRNDDGGEGNNSRLDVTFPQDGTYRIIASAYGSATGPYTLRVAEPPAAEDPARAQPVGRLSVGEDHSGTLSADDSPLFDDRPGQVWTIEGRSGQTVTIDHISEDFDSYLYVFGPGLSRLSDDDSAGSLDSRLTVTFPQNGTYRIVASALGSGTGAYTIRVTAGQ